MEFLRSPRRRRRGRRGKEPQTRFSVTPFSDVPPLPAGVGDSDGGGRGDRDRVDAPCGNSIGKSFLIRIQLRPLKFLFFLAEKADGRSFAAVPSSSSSSKGAFSGAKILASLAGLSGRGHLVRHGSGTVGVRPIRARPFIALLGPLLLEDDDCRGLPPLRAVHRHAWRVPAAPAGPRHRRERLPFVSFRDPKPRNQIRQRSKGVFFRPEPLARKNVAHLTNKSL